MIGPETEHAPEAADAIELGARTRILGVEMTQIANPAVPRHEWIASTRNSLGNRENVFHSPVGHVIDVDDHSKSHHLLDGEFAYAGTGVAPRELAQIQSFLVAVAGTRTVLRRLGQFHVFGNDAVERSRDRPVEFVEDRYVRSPEADLVVRVRLRPGTLDIPEMTCLEDVGRVERDVVGRRAAEHVVRDMDREDVPHALDVKTRKLFPDLVRSRRRLQLEIPDVVDLDAQHDGDLRLDVLGWVPPHDSGEIRGVQRHFHEIRMA